MATKPKTAKTTTRPTTTARNAAVTTPVDALLETGRSVAERQFQAGCALFTGNFDRMMTTMINNTNEAASANTEMFEATTQYFQTWTKGCEDVAKSYATFCQSMMQDWMNCCKSTMSAKNVQDAVSMQTDFVRQQFDKAMSESTRMSETIVKVASDAAEPMQSQWTSMVSRYSKAA